MKRKMTGIALLAATALAAGCGGDDEEAISKADYVKQGNKICADFNASVDKDASKAFAGIASASDVTPEKATQFFDAARPKFDAVVEDLVALGAPQGDEDAVKAIIDAGKADSQKIADADGEGLVALVAGNAATPDFDQKAEEYGLKECGSQD